MATYWSGEVPERDNFGDKIDQMFIDGNTLHGWAIMTPKSFSIYGIGYGTGRGQLYERTTQDGKVRWIKIAG